MIMSKSKKLTDVKSGEEVISPLDTLVMRQTENKKFAEQVLKLYYKYNNILNGKDIKNHNLIVTMFQNLRDKNSLSA